MTDDLLQNLADRLNEILKESISKNYPYAPGFNNSSPFRVKGAGPKRATGNFIDNSEVVFNKETKNIEMYLPDYWSYINYGVPGSGDETVERERTSKKGTKYIVKVPKWMPPVSAIREWATVKGIDLGENEGKLYGIRYRIGKYGVAGTNFYDEVLIKLEEYLEENLQIEVEEVINDLLDNILTKTFEIK